jgi:ribosomal protein S18 acetylase RimI-like enzyme
VIRPYLPSDRDAISDICLRTGDAGGDAREKYADAPGLLGDVFALPYVEHDPGLAFVLDDGDRAVGYVLGTADTPAYVDWFREVWLPPVARRYPLPVDPPSTPTETVIALLHRPERMLVPQLADLPAHLHIDLLPQAQGAGHGRALMETFLRALGARGVPRVHLGMSRANTGARAFYDRLGFTEVPVPDDGALYLCRDTLTP